MWSTLPNAFRNAFRPAMNGEPVSSMSRSLTPAHGNELQYSSSPSLVKMTGRGWPAAPWTVTPVELELTLRTPSGEPIVPYVPSLPATITSSPEFAPERAVASSHAFAGLEQLPLPFDVGAE
jgi:hypothetical protein